MIMKFSPNVNYYLCTAAAARRLVARGWESGTAANDASIYKTELPLVLSSVRSLFCLNIRSFGNVAAARDIDVGTVPSPADLILLT